MANENAYPNSDFLRIMASRAGKIALQERKAGMTIDTKFDGSPITPADVAINSFMLERLEKDFPHVSFLGEEGNRIVENNSFKVIGDPIDGTTAFARGLPGATFCIALVRVGIPHSAVIHEFDGKTWWADRKEGVWCDEEPIRVSGHCELEGSVVCVIHFPNPCYNRRLSSFLDSARVHCFNPLSTGYYGALVASGQIDAIISPARMGWEAAAIECLVTAAGGKVTNLNGLSLCYDEDGSIGNGFIASNGLIHDRLLEIISQSRDN